jgi:hypothetical protein
MLDPGRPIGVGLSTVGTQATTSRPLSPVGRENSVKDSRARRWLIAAAWVVGSIALTSVYLRISLASRVGSDGANNVLQAWDLLHGHLMLPGWQIGDANYYFLELPLLAVADAFFGVGNLAAHVASALTYMLVTVVALAAAGTGSRGPARAVRYAVVLAVLAAPLLSGLALLALEEPDHIGTSVFIIGAFLLIDRLPAHRFSAPLLLVILVAGQFGDLITRYVAVPAIVLVCGYRALAARKLRSPDTVLAATAVVSVPLSSLMTAVWVHFGGFTTATTRGGLDNPDQWPHNAVTTWDSLRVMFGALGMPGVTPGSGRAAFGLVCLLAALFGVAWVAWRWNRASTAEQLLAAAIVVNVAVFFFSSFAWTAKPHEIAVVLPCGAVLAARALVPARDFRAPLAAVAVAATALLVALPLAYAATRPVFTPEQAPLVAWLEAHQLTHGLATYQDGAASTVLSGNRIQLRVIHRGAVSLGDSHYEVNSQWYDQSRNYANFVVANPEQKLPAAMVERYFGKPAAIYQVQGWTVLVYRMNLLGLLTPS